jgi:hypothetical protein
MTGLAGVALMMEGSTLNEGKYADNIRRAVGWLIERSNKNGAYDGLIGDPNHPSEAGRYMVGHGHAMVFLARVYGDEDDAKRRGRLKDVLTRAAQFSARAQSSKGGWFFTSRLDGTDPDEGEVCVVQFHALQEVRNAGIPVPRDAVQKGRDYLAKSTTEKGGVVDSLGKDDNPAPAGHARPAVTAAALGVVLSGGNFKDPLIKRWFKFCQVTIPLRPDVRLGMDEFLHYYYSQAVYQLGDDGWKRMFPDSGKDGQITWSAYRQARFDFLVEKQDKDGSWKFPWSAIGPVYDTALNLTVMQLDNQPLRRDR